VFVTRIEIRELHMRLLHPFQTSFGSTTERHIILVNAVDGRNSGWGEVTAAEGPFYSYETWKTAWHILRDFIIPSVIGKKIREPAEFGSLVAGIRGHNMAKAGLETALWDLDAKAKGVPLWKLLGGKRDRIDCGVSSEFSHQSTHCLRRLKRN
jgi:o-succinylbenzoate synthase